MWRLDEVTNLQRLRSDLKCLLHTTANALDTYEHGVMSVLGERPGQDTAQEWAKPKTEDVRPRADSDSRRMYLRVF